eukprot:1159816-Pelagomonas_calceolata.AAC.3
MYKEGASKEGGQNRGALVEKGEPIELARGQAKGACALNKPLLLKNKQAQNRGRLWGSCWDAPAC